MSNDDLVQTAIEVPKDAKNIVKERYGHGGLSRIVRDAIETAAYGDQSDIQHLKTRADDLRSDINKKRREKQAVENEITDLQTELRIVQEQIDAIRDKRGEYEGALRMIEQDLLEDGARVFVNHPKIEQAARLGDCSQPDVIDDLKDRNPDLPDERFEPATDI